MAGIPQRIAFSKIQLLSYQLKYAGITLNRLPQDLPGAEYDYGIFINFPLIITIPHAEVYSTRIGDANASEERRAQFINDHKKSIARFEAVHEEMVGWGIGILE